MTDATDEPGNLTPIELGLRTRLWELLRAQGLEVNTNQLVVQRTYAKEQVRSIHALSRQERLVEEQAFVRKWLPRVRKYLASGLDVDPTKIEPEPVLVADDEMAALFRIASLWWSVPVSRGYGRRFRIVVLDRANGKLIGLLGLTDPVFNLRARDLWVGWDVRQREDRLAHVMDAFVLGAVPPYNKLLGAKLIAGIAASDFIRGVFKSRYGTETSLIRKREFDGRLALLTATSALGRSSIYNRLRFEDQSVYQMVGATEGYGHFHLANGTYETMREYLRSIGDEEVVRSKYGNGPNYRLRVIRHALTALGLPADLLRHGIRRSVYMAPLAANTQAFLRGEHTRLRWHHRPLSDVIQSWRDRWMLPKALRDPAYRDFRLEEWSTITGEAGL